MDEAAALGPGGTDGGSNDAGSARPINNPGSDPDALARLTGGSADDQNGGRNITTGTSPDPDPLSELATIDDSCEGGAIADRPYLSDQPGDKLVLGRTSSRRRSSREILSSGSILVTQHEGPVRENSGEKLSALHDHAVSRPLGQLAARCLNVIAVR